MESTMLETFGKMFANSTMEDLVEKISDVSGPILEEVGRTIGLEVGRQIFNNQNISVNALGILAALALLGALGLKLLFGLSLFDVMDAMTGGYGSSGGTGYGQTGYGAPSTGYGHGGESSVYVAPSNGYSSRSSKGDMVELTDEQKELYPEIAGIRDQLKTLQDAETNLKRHIYYNSNGEGSELHNSGTEQIGFGY